MPAVVPPAFLQLADSSPTAEAKSPAAGSMDTASRGDHTHPRLTSAANVTLDANGYATITFTRTFATEPVLVFGSLGSGTEPVPDFRGNFIQTNGVYTGVTIYGQRARAMPMINPISTGLLSILSVLQALNPVLAQLSGFTPYEAAAGARVSVTAIQASA
jgi:hypothetical protein